MEMNFSSECLKRISSKSLYIIVESIASNNITHQLSSQILSSFPSVGLSLDLFTFSYKYVVSILNTRWRISAELISQQTLLTSAGICVYFAEEKKEKQKNLVKSVLYKANKKLCNFFLQRKVIQQKNLAMASNKVVKSWIVI